MKKRKIGMLVAVEIDAVVKKWGFSLSEKQEAAGCEIYRYETEQFELIILHSGMGEIAAAAGVQLLITAYQIDLLVNFGVVGGLTDQMKTTNLCVVDKVIHYDFDISALDGSAVGQYPLYPDAWLYPTKELVQQAVSVSPELSVVTCASADKFVGEPSQKQELHQRFGADICEMEAAAIVLTCSKNQMPCLLIKCVSDSVEGGAEEFASMIDHAAQICLDLVLKVLENMENS